MLTNSKTRQVPHDAATYSHDNRKGGPSEITRYDVSTWEDPELEDILLAVYGRKPNEGVSVTMDCDVALGMAYDLLDALQKIGYVDGFTIKHL